MCNNKVCNKICFTVFIVFTIILLSWGVVRLVYYYKFANNCSGYLERASNANSVEMAEQNLNKAILYLENNNLTSGWVTIFLKQPKNDIEYWYGNLKVAQKQLQDIDKNTITNLEESNVLMKLRETLTDVGDNGTDIICPNGISIYPHNNLFFIWGIGSFVVACIFGFKLLLI